MYSVTIEIPPHIHPEVKDRPKPILVKFKTKEEKDFYVHEEIKNTKPALEGLAKAFTPKQRGAAYLNLYKARKAFSSMFLKEVTEKVPA